MPLASLVIKNFQCFSGKQLPTIQLLSRLKPGRSMSTMNTEVKDPLHGSYHWCFERLIATGTMFALGAMIFLPSASQLVDASLMVLLPIHTYQGFSAVIIDYLPKRKFKIIYTICKGSLLLITGISVYGLYKFNTENIGISTAIRKLWQETKVE